MTACAGRHVHLLAFGVHRSTILSRLLYCDSSSLFCLCKGMCTRVPMHLFVLQSLMH